MIILAGTTGATGAAISNVTDLMMAAPPEAVMV